MDDVEAKQKIRQGVNLILDAILDVIYYDPHEWHSLPCDACRSITNTLARPFGCYRYAADRDYPRRPA